MAITPRNLKTTNTVGPLKRIKSDLNENKTFAADAGGSAVTLVAGTPVAFNTSTDLWVPWLHNGANGTDEIRGIAWPDDIVINASGGGEVIGSVMMRGEAHYEDLDVSAVASTSANLVTALQQGGSADNLRTLGIDIKGLDKVI